ncbi:hypothetical protein PIB30_105211 [Stylosanthes scabra]|uniref:Uncharacterized protein n=1 Tax=Stylosanthes scabra TaxID=79078 RepID=A0ABU6RZ00_9FABA|nr:hypothetical protein [Stylosanthes scabra]
MEGVREDPAADLRQKRRKRKVLVADSAWKHKVNPSTTTRIAVKPLELGNLLLREFSPDDACPLGAQLSAETTEIYQAGMKDDKHLPTHRRRSPRLCVGDARSSPAAASPTHMRRVLRIVECES